MSWRQIRIDLDSRLGKSFYPSFQDPVRNLGWIAALLWPGGPWVLRQIPVQIPIQFICYDTTTTVERPLHPPLGQCRYYHICNNCNGPHLEFHRHAAK